MKIKKRIASVLTVLILSSACLADDLYVKNKLFKGRVEGAGQSLRVDAKTLLEYLKFTDYSIVDGVLVIGETRIPLQESLVSLQQLADAVGAKIVVNADLKTVDVYQSTEKRAYTPPPVKETKKDEPGREYYAGGWQTDWAAAARVAKRTGKPMMVYFAGSDW